MKQYREIETGGAPIKAWVDGVPLDPVAEQQLRQMAQLPFIHRHLAVMPDVHVGIGATVGSVIATRGAIVPAAVGVDIGCGMMAVQTSVSADRLPTNLEPLRVAIERSVPHGSRKAGGWKDSAPSRVSSRWRQSGLAERLDEIEQRHRSIRGANSLVHLGTLGSGNHFIELCLDEANMLWVMLHSGSRGIGNRIGTYFIEQARKLIEGKDLGFHLPHRDLAFFVEGTDPMFDEYVEAVQWAQDFARLNRELMMDRVLLVLRDHLPRFRTSAKVVNCHHNYVARETHFGDPVWVTRKGAVRAGVGDMGIIPGSMGARSFIVRGRGQADSFCSCSHGAGRLMSRSKARETFTLTDHRRATEGVECRKDRGVIDETPGAYKDVDAVMAAQADLVEVVHTLHQVICVKG